MKLLLLTHAFNGLAQRLFVELRERGHTVSVELDIADAVTEEAVARFEPDVIVAPFLKRRIPSSIWSQRPCLVVHPGLPGDRGPSALDWALFEGRTRWGVTVLQANDDFDAGAVWAWRAFDVPPGITKGSLYRQCVTPAAVEAVVEALARIGAGEATPAVDGRSDGAAKVTSNVIGDAESDGIARALPGWRPVLGQDLRRIDWAQHDTADILRRVRSADGAPGALAPLFGEDCRLFDGHEATADEAARAAAAQPGEAVARRGPALLLRTRDAAVWIGHVRRAPMADGQPALKLAATQAFGEFAAELPPWDVPLMRDATVWDELRYRESGPLCARVGWLDMEFHNGALSERQAQRLLDALAFARSRDTRVLVLAGGRDFFGNGIHLHAIEAAAHVPGDSAADASWRHIQAIDDVALALLQMTDRLTVATLRGNAGAGGCFLALAADRVWMRQGVVLNPHYRNMGNLYGSEYWTYLLPRRVGAEPTRDLMRQRLPMGAAEARRRGLVDEVFGGTRECLRAAPCEVRAWDGTASACVVAATDHSAVDARFSAALDAFDAQALQRAQALAADPGWAAAVHAKAERRAADEAQRPLADYRAAELAQMRRNFYGFDPSYHVARHHFVHRKPHAWTPRHLALHR